MSLFVAKDNCFARSLAKIDYKYDLANCIASRNAWQRRLACPSVRYQDSSVLKLYLVSGFWTTTTPRLSSVAATDGALVLEEYSAILPFPAPPFSFLCGHASLPTSLLLSSFAISSIRPKFRELALERNAERHCNIA